MVDGRFVEIRIEDDGQGIPEGDMARMLEPFTRGEPSRNSATGGAGLGLALARAIGRTLKPGDEIVTTKLDHDANVYPWLELAHDLGLVVHEIGAAREVQGHPHERLVERHERVTVATDPRLVPEGLAQGLGEHRGVFVAGDASTISTSSGT